MTEFEEYVEARAAAVHESWMAGQRAAGITSRTSALTGAELMVPYDRLPGRDKDVDRATVRTVLDDPLLLAALRDMFKRLDPLPAGLAERCARCATGGDPGE